MTNINEYKIYKTKSYLPAHMKRAGRVFNSTWRKWYMGGCIPIKPTYWLNLYAVKGLERLVYQRSLCRGNVARGYYEQMMIDYRAKWNQIAEIEWGWTV